jgi:hypothetical protein
MFPDIAAIGLSAGPGWVKSSAVASGFLPATKTLDEAMAVVKPFIEPLHDGAATGQWDPQSGSWTGETGI